MYRVLQIAIMVLMVAALWLGALPAAAETVDPGSVCYRIVVSFDAEEDSVISGQVGIHYRDGERSELVNVPFGTLNIAEDTRVNVAEAKVTDMRGFRVSLNTDGTIVSGEGRYRTRIIECDTLYINDGRLNIDQLGMLAVIYYNAQTRGYDVYGVNPGTGQGDLAIRVNRATVDQALNRATTPGGANTLIQNVGGVSLWALTSNECQLNSFNVDGTLDEFVFACAVQTPTG
jgi:hypothetical protein